jgi:hypothetical protein
MSQFVAAVAADRNITVSFFKEVPTQIKAGGQAMLREHPQSGAFIEDSFKCNGRGGAQVMWMLQGQTRSEYRETKTKTRTKTKVENVFKVVLLLAIQENE